jgi:shikimate kinase
MMGAGKSTVGRAVAERTGWPYLDNDEIVALASGMPTREVLATQGEASLRRAELAALDAVLAVPPPVVGSIAAGVVLDPSARDRMRDAFVVYLRATLATLTARVGSGMDRPWLGGDPELELQRLLEGRDPLYLEIADLVIDVDTAAPADIATRIVRASQSDAMRH